MPSGFSSAIRTVGQASPAPSSPSIVGLNNDGAVEKKDRDSVAWIADRLGKPLEPRRILDVERHVMQPFEEALGNRVVKKLAGNAPSIASAPFPKGSIVESVRAVPMIRRSSGEAIQIEPEQRRQEHAPGKIAGRAEHEKGRGLFPHAALLEAARAQAKAEILTGRRRNHLR